MRRSGGEAVVVTGRARAEVWELVLELPDAVCLASRRAATTCDRIDGTNSSVLDAPTVAARRAQPAVLIRRADRSEIRPYAPWAALTSTRYRLESGRYERLVEQFHHLPLVFVCLLSILPRVRPDRLGPSGQDLGTFGSTKVRAD